MWWWPTKRACWWLDVTNPSIAQLWTRENPELAEVMLASKEGWWEHDLVIWWDGDNNSQHMS